MKDILNLSLCRNKNKSLCLFEQVPNKGIAQWLDSDGCKDSLSLHTESKTFTSVKWSDNKPTDVVLIAKSDYEELVAKAKLAKSSKVTDEDKNFAEEMYKLYPSFCPMRNTSTSKCSKDKQKIIKLLKTHSKGEIRAVINYEVEHNYGKNYLKNFGTFLNNLPDINELGITIEEETKTPTTKQVNDKLVINGVEYK